MSRNTCILFVFLFAGCKPQAPHIPNVKKIAAIVQKIDDLSRNNWKTMRLNNHVSSIVQFTYNKDVADTTAADYQGKEYYSFDTTGNTIERTIYNSERFDSRSILKYNKDNKVIETAYYAEDGTLNYKEYNLFDTAGNLMETGERHANGTVRVNTFKYNEHRSIIESNIGDKVTHFENTYDNEDVRIGAKVTFTDGMGFMKLKQDSAGNVLESGQYFMDGKAFKKSEFIYNEHGKEIKSIATDHEGKVVTYEFTYDTHGNLTDSKGARKSFRMIYEYDPMGNWTKRTTVDGENNISEVLIRSIRYY